MSDKFTKNTIHTIILNKEKIPVTSLIEMSINVPATTATKKIN